MVKSLVLMTKKKLLLTVGIAMVVGCSGPTPVEPKQAPGSPTLNEAQLPGVAPQKMKGNGPN